MGPSRGEHLLSERERGPESCHPFSLQFLVSCEPASSGCLAWSSLRLILSLLPVCHISWSECHNNTQTGGWETVFLVVNKLPPGEDENCNERSASVISLRLFRCNNKEVEAGVGEENINSIATNPSCDCETIHHIDISQQPIRKDGELNNYTEETETCKPPSPEKYEEETILEDECDNKVQSSYEIVS